MDYLVYVEYNAECLQFFLWYCDYVNRWSQLPCEARDLSPMWRSNNNSIDEADASAGLHHRHSRTNSFTEKTDRLNHILTILEKTPKKQTDSSLWRSETDSKPTVEQSSKPNFSRPRGVSSDGAASSSTPGQDQHSPKRKSRRFSSLTPQTRSQPCGELGIPAEVPQS
jgi:hypothetical protein